MTPVTSSEGPAPTGFLLRSLSSAAIGDRSGDLTLYREARGAVDDWGGVFGQLVRLTGAWRLSIFDGTTDLALSDAPGTGLQQGDRWRSEHRLGPLLLRQEIAPVARPPGVVRRVWLSAADGRPLSVVVHSAFGPYLLPVMVEGIRPRSFRASTTRDGIEIRQRGFGLSVRSSPLPDRLYLNRGSWIGGRYTGPIREFGTDHELSLAPGTTAEVRWLVSGGLEADLDRSAAEALDVLADPEPRLRAAEAAEAAWAEGVPVVRLPDAPPIEAGYAAAVAALRRLYSAPDDSLTGLVAGYPWYSSLWCRDIAWMLPAVIWLGDFDWAARTISTVFRYRARSPLPLLGGEPGELPMQLSPGPIFLYGTSDTSLYYPGLADLYRSHSGDDRTAGEWLPAIRAVVAWGWGRSDPATGLFRNGGEAEEISAATSSLGRVHYGIDAPDTTIWDSADRRDHAIDVQVLWTEALRASARLDPTDAGGRSAAERVDRSERLTSTVRTAYDWPEERYLYDSLRGGRPVAQVRPNALRAVSGGLLEPDRALRLVRRAAEDDLLADWGVRTLSRRDPGYRPDAYHDGQVWTIATLWAADAALAAGETELGVELLGRAAARYAAEGGGANECYRGDRPEAYNSCFLLGLSVGPYIATVFERLWGLSMDAHVPRLTVLPRFPPSWRSASIDRLRLGGGFVGLEFARPRLTVRWSGPRSLAVSTTAGEDAVPPGGAVTRELPEGSIGGGERRVS